MKKKPDNKIRGKRITIQVPMIPKVSFNEDGSNKYEGFKSIPVSINELQETKKERSKEIKFRSGRGRKDGSGAWMPLSYVIGSVETIRSKDASINIKTASIQIWLECEKIPNIGKYASPNVIRKNYYIGMHKLKPSIVDEQPGEDNVSTFEECMGSLVAGIRCGEIWNPEYILDSLAENYGIEKAEEGIRTCAREYRKLKRLPAPVQSN